MFQPQEEFSVVLKGNLKELKTKLKYDIKIKTTPKSEDMKTRSMGRFNFTDVKVIRIKKYYEGNITTVKVIRMKTMKIMLEL